MIQRMILLSWISLRSRWWGDLIINSGISGERQTLPYNLILRCLFFCISSDFFLTGNPFFSYKYIYLKKIVFVFSIRIDICIFFSILGRIAAHYTCLARSHRSWVNWRGILFYPKHNLSWWWNERENKKNRGILSIMVEVNIRSQTLRLSPAPLMLPQIR